MARPTDWGETKLPHKLRFTPTCWKILQAIADDKRLPSKTEVIEHYARNYHLVEAVLNAVESVLYDATATEETLPPHAAYEVDGDAIRELGDAFRALAEAQDSGD